MRASAPPARVPPEAELVRQRRENQPPFYSVRAAAAAVTAAGTRISASGWTNIETGKYDATPDKLAAMARLLGITADELEQVGRGAGRENAVRAATLLREDLRARVEAEPELARASESMPEAVLQALADGIDDIRRAPGLSPDQRTAMEQVLIRSVLQHVRGQVEQVRTTLEIVAGRTG